MRAIRTFGIKDGLNEIAMPRGSRLLSVSWLAFEVILIAIVDETEQKVVREVFVGNVGKEYDERVFSGVFIGSVSNPDFAYGSMKVVFDLRERTGDGPTT